MAFVIPAAPAANTNYTAGQRVSLNGVTYEATTGITGDSNVPDPSTDGVNWKAVAVTSLDNLNALVEGVRLQLNTSADEIYESIPLFLNLTEESLKTRIRLPHQIRTVTVMVDSEFRVRVPAGLLEIMHVRRKDDTFNSGIANTPYDNDVVEILASDREEYLRVLRAQESYGRDFFSFDSAVYWWDRAYLHFAPQYEEGTEIEITYYQLIPKLGTTVTVVGSDGTTTEEVVVTNEFLQIAPQVLLYGACLRAKPFLHDEDPRISQWTEMYVAAEKELQYLIETFENHQAHTLFLQNTYAQNI